MNRYPIGSRGRGVSQPRAARVGVFAALGLSAILLTGCPSKPSASGPSTSDPPAQPASDPLADAVDSGAFEFRLLPPTESGIDTVYLSGSDADQSTILESLGGGVAACDFDRDGILDLLAAGGGTISNQQQIGGLPNHLYRGLGELRWENVSQMAGLIASQPLYSHGFAVSDYDNDGFPDIVVTGYGGLQLWKNQGDGSFVERTQQAGLTDRLWSSSAGWGDLNGDGLADLYVAHYVDWGFETNHPYCPDVTGQRREICSPRRYDGLADIVYLNRGDGTFAEAGKELGLQPGGKGLGVVLADVDVDQDVDVYVGNDTTDNFLYLNQGDGKLVEDGVLAGVATDDDGVPNGSMGLDVCDFNRDGLPDLWAANYEHESFALYRNEDQGSFLHVSGPTGITAMGGLFVGFGTGFVDLDLDGDEDVIVVNGHVIKYPTGSPRKQVPVLLEHDGSRFRRVPFSETTFFGTPREARGLALADWDGDGDLDLAVSLIGEPAAIVENRTRHNGSWIALDLVGVTASRDAVGATVVLHTSAGDLLRCVKGGGSYLSHSGHTLHWGIPAGADVTGATVRWPYGGVQQVELSAADLGSVRRVVQQPAK